MLFIIYAVQFQEGNATDAYKHHLFFLITIKKENERGRVDKNDLSDVSHLARFN